MKEIANIKNQTQKKIATKAGFTLVETLFTIFIFSLLMVGISLMIKDIFTTSTQQYSLLNNVNQARSIANTFTNEIRNSTYGADGAYPLGQASNTQIIFFSTAPNPNGAVARVRYYVTGNTLYKGVTNPTGSPSAYNLAGEKITTVATNLSIGANPLFYYYNGNYNGSGSALTQPVNLNQVTFVQMNLIVLKQLTQTSTTTFTISAGGSMRNLKTNLGS